MIPVAVGGLTLLALLALGTTKGSAISGIVGIGGSSGGSSATVPGRIGDFLDDIGASGSAIAGLGGVFGSVKTSASNVLAEPEQPAFVVVDTEVNADARVVAAGEEVVVEATIENRGDLSGARRVTLELDDVEDDAALEIPSRSTETATLRYRTRAADAGERLAFTVDTENDTTEVPIEVVPPDEVETARAEARERMTDTPEPDTADPTDAADEDGEDEETVGLLGRVWANKGPILSYIAGGLLIWVGVTRLQANPIGGALRVFLGVFLFPIVRAQLPTSYRVVISRYGKTIIVILAIVLGTGIVGVEGMLDLARSLPERLGRLLS